MAGEHCIDRTLKASFLSSPLHPSLSHPSPPIVWPFLPPPPPRSSYQHQLWVTNPPAISSEARGGHKFTRESRDNWRGGVYLSNSQHHRVENRDMGMREGCGDSRGLWDGDSGWREVGVGGKHSDDFPWVSFIRTTEEGETERKKGGESSCRPVTNSNLNHGDTSVFKRERDAARKSKPWHTHTHQTSSEGPWTPLIVQLKS